MIDDVCTSPPHCAGAGSWTSAGRQRQHSDSSCYTQTAAAWSEQSPQTPARERSMSIMSIELTLPTLMTFPNHLISGLETGWKWHSPSVSSQSWWAHPAEDTEDTERLNSHPTLGWLDKEQWTSLKTAKLIPHILMETHALVANSGHNTQVSTTRVSTPKQKEWVGW